VQCSSVIYTEEGACEEYRIYRRNPDLVLVDTAVIAKSPVRHLVAGMGDALTTWFEAKVCADTGAKNMRGGALLQDAAGGRHGGHRRAEAPGIQRCARTPG